MGRQNEADIVHETGYKDDYKVAIYHENLASDEGWAPTNQEIFTLLDKVFQSEEHEFGDGYGNKWLWFYISMIMLGKEDKAYEAYGLRGYKALAHFENVVEENADELIEILEDLKEKTC